MKSRSNKAIAASPSHWAGKLGWPVSPSATNFLWVKPNGNAAQITQTLQEHHIYIRHYTDPKLRNHVRITVGTEASNQKLLQVLNSIL
ncbi:MAG: aminotransferase class I/II-fold pyridoxal phosphate-dependent enzyme [Acaryochloridaceae cyanobacterium RL_2_7]|nr:aminotransferase class I/II-fold pyridoxal phosphate-dependent enzyme [Acaryochloridaceae cyanobacterium RL_2_7]